MQRSLQFLDYFQDGIDLIGCAIAKYFSELILIDIIYLGNVGTKQHIRRNLECFCDTHKGS